MRLSPIGMIYLKMLKPRFAELIDSFFYVSKKHLISIDPDSHIIEKQKRSKGHSTTQDTDIATLIGISDSHAFSKKNEFKNILLEKIPIIAPFIGISDSHAFSKLFALRMRLSAYIFLLYCPPTSNIAWVICPSEQTLVASINSLKIFSFLIEASLIFSKAASAESSLAL